jgi:hypothetical protein
VKTIEFIIVVGFHHKVGSQVEYIYPSLSQDKDENLTTNFIKHIPLVALPDGSHAIEVTYLKKINL